MQFVGERDNDGSIAMNAFNLHLANIHRVIRTMVLCTYVVEKSSEELEALDEVAIFNLPDV